jgi:hypothetical protein
MVLAERQRPTEVENDKGLANVLIHAEFLNNLAAQDAVAEVLSWGHKPE